MQVLRMLLQLASWGTLVMVALLHLLLHVLLL
jgi:hypothetical protein